jgi:photosynthetic reaction center cytochrome c subunit
MPARTDPQRTNNQIVTPASAGEPAGATRCKTCHSAEVDGYARSAMAHSLRRAGQEPTGIVTTPAGTITMSSTSAGSWQSLQAGGDVSTYRVDYVIGSGNHAFGYLLDIAGHLFQSPVAFYKSRNTYDLAPGYEKEQDPDFTRPVAEGCVFCHVGTELHVSGTDNQFRAPVFPAEAISCERCHGPSEKHLADPRAGTIVNPAKLEPGARDGICEQCHLMGAARVPNPGREFRDFQPGQRLETTFTTYHDAMPPDSVPGGFKVISHVEQLAMSVCARSSQGKLWCGTCHDPHNKPTQPVAYYRSRCLSCHTAAFAQPHPGADSDCIGCHMPRRDAQDGGHSAFTDHRIQRHPQPLPDTPPAGDIAAWREPAPEFQKRNLGIASISAGLQRRNMNLLVSGYRLLAEVQNEFPTDPDLFSWMGTALLVGKQASEAEFAFERSLALRPDSAVAETNLASAHRGAGDMDGGMAHLERAVAIDPLQLPATSLLIRLYRQQGNEAKASELSERVLALMEERPDPTQAVQGSVSGSPKLAGTVFKNLKVLNQSPSDQIIPGMRFITSSLGVNCNFCHVEGHFEDDAKKEKEIARGMMRMMFAINQNNFEGSRKVTCYSCHRGAPKPVAIPVVASGTTPALEGGANDAKTEELPSDLPTGDQIVDSFVRALGGSAALERITSRVESGSAETGGNSVRVEVWAKAPGKRLFIQHTPAGDSVTGSDGSAEWIRLPAGPIRDINGAEVDAARIDADLQFPLHIKQVFPELRVEYPETVDGHKAFVVLGVREHQPPWKFYFDAQSGLLVRLVRYAESPLGLDPTQIDFGDYRAVDDVQTPFNWTIARAGSRSTIQITEIHQNIPMDDAKFSRPSSSQQSP